MSSQRDRKLKPLSAVLHFIACFALVVFFTGTFDSAAAADDPASTARASNELDIPGSFKDLPEAKDRVTAKRSPEQIAADKLAKAGVESVIDLTKVTGPAPAGPASTASPVTSDFNEADLIDFDATAYCLKGRTASGASTKPGMIAADPRVLPLGTVVHLRSGSYTGTYTVTDTGGRIKGRRVDIYVPTHREAVQFGRRQVKIKVISRAAKTDRESKSILASER